MHDAKPVLTLLVLCGCGLLWLGLHWVGMSVQVRQHRLTAIAVAEEAETLPPTRFAAQARWLLTHRRTRVQGLSLLVGLGALIGFSEGLVWRHQDPRAGMGLRNWTLGLMSLALAMGLVGGLVLFPLPWSVSVVAGSGGLWSALTGFLLSKGYPYVA